MLKPLIAANWKMNPIPDGALENSSSFRSSESVDVVVFPTYLDLQPCIQAGLIVGAQYGRNEENGAFTGDISIIMLKNLGCAYILCGHSERRLYHNETNEQVAQQAESALNVGLHPIICIGETAQEREEGRTEEVLKSQLTPIFEILKGQNTFSIAYEPVWAIGTGLSATPEIAQKAHSFIRSLLPPNSSGNDIRILYGGSMKPENASELLCQSDINGGLIGGASLDQKKFLDIVNIAAK
ncbi:triose-phosphate isomerase [Candidatus Peregrinibacteria bacterium]|jgi:triosephosphate isomerase|nr:triose-phosphate isomerase [Candidatus Peregrinibacteria bacterium]MBT3599106.1 triose-phosphate isomerase [Candidatus Peregrinibacteria bacterium]MBT4367659.1 triose-phosphate isomerase [Candidatus Peregrinibacteria bacterium]MBT4585437.1 triose-phosphate isomerase [Candidatus Peregrinibacteria bacterium]MBT6730412.1 triose-phosphate isomerase [Candidatus Peregrinibacteria bacterium]